MGEGKNSRLEYLLLFAVLAMVSSAYCNTLYSPPCLDDFHSFIFEKSVYLKEITPSSLLSLSQNKFGWGRWIPSVTFALDHKIGNSETIYFHLTNLFIHLLAALAVFSLIKQILLAQSEKNGKEWNGIYRFLPVCVAALWATNPVQTSAVTYLVQRMASLQALFYIFSVASYIRARIFARKNSRLRYPWYGAAAAAGLCSLLSKQNALMLPFMLIATEVWFFEGAAVSAVWKKLRNSHRMAQIALALAGLLVVCAAFGPAYRIATEPYAQRNFTMIERLMTESRIVVWYMSLLLWPDPSRLSMEHDIDISTSLLSPPTTLLSILFIGLLFFGIFRTRKKLPLLGYGMLWYFANLAIESTVIPLELIFEHRMYLPSAGFFLSVVAGSLWLIRLASTKMPPRELGKAACCVCLVLASCLTLLTFTRNEAWENGITLGLDTVSKTPDNPRSYGNLANAYFHERQYPQAIEAAEKAVQLSRPHYESYAVGVNSIVISLIQLGEIDKAIERGEEFLDAIPKDIDVDSVPPLCINLAEVHRERGELAKGYELLMKALRYIQGTDKSAFKMESAVHEMQFILHDCLSRNVDINGDGRPDPGDLSVSAWIATELRKKGEMALVKQFLGQALLADANDEGAKRIMASIQEEEQRNRVQKEKWNAPGSFFSNPSLFNLTMNVATFVEERRLPSPLAGFGEMLADRAIGMRPDSPEAHLLKGWCAYSKDDSGLAVREARTALGLDPENARSWLGLGFFLSREGETREAIAAFDKVIDLYPGYSRRATIETLQADLAKKDSAGADSNQPAQGNTSAVPAEKEGGRSS